MCRRRRRRANNTTTPPYYQLGLRRERERRPKEDESTRELYIYKCLIRSSSQPAYDGNAGYPPQPGYQPQLADYPPQQVTTHIHTHSQTMLRREVKLPCLFDEHAR